MGKLLRKTPPGAIIPVLLLLLLLAGCAALGRLDAVPRAAEDDATVLGLRQARYWGDGDASRFREAMLQALRREREWRLEHGMAARLPPAEFLAVSGGGENGAFGAGLLLGWTAAGTRPMFKAVTGISTGALTAPFAFLGPAYDKQLMEVYTTLSAKDILRRRGIMGVLFEDAFADTTPLRDTVARYVDHAMLEAIAAEHAKGRVLLIGTTNLDARRPVIWNLGEIAASRHPGALGLIHDILVASAAIPGAFPPVMIEAEAGGQRYEEMHVDGGASAQVFAYPPALDFREVRQARERRLYVIRNARLDPDWAEVERTTFGIMSRAVSSLIQTQGIGDLYQIFLTTKRDGVDFNLAYIPPTFTRKLEQPFETAYMNELFRLGYELGSAGYRWAKAPPGYALKTESRQ